MKIFIFKISIFLLSFICIDTLFGLAFKKLYYNVKSGPVFTTNYALRKCNEEILIFGASEVSHSLVSNQISDCLKMACYNLGMDGQSIYYQYAILNEILKLHKPKIVIVSTFVLHEGKTTIEALFPYFYDYQSIKDIIEEIKPDEKYKLFIRSYAYNSLIINVLQGNILKEPLTNGYKPLYGIGNDIQVMPEPSKIGSSDRAFAYFEKFIQACLSSKCKVYVIDTPRFTKQIDISETDRIKVVLEKYSIKYLNFATDTTFINHPNLFKDKEHLNNNGAVILTNLIIDEIRTSNLF